MDSIGSINDMAVVVLAAGRGERLRPLTDSTPKPLCPVGGRPIIDWVVERLGVSDEQVAVNAHYLAGQIVSHFRRRPVHVEVEDEILGTAGAIGNLAHWIDGRDVLIHNGDAWIDGDLTRLWRGWDRQRPRLLVSPTPRRSDFGKARFIGASLLPAANAAQLKAVPSDLYRVIWKTAYDAGGLELVTFDGTAIDCGTWNDYRRADRIATALGRAER